MASPSTRPMPALSTRAPTWAAPTAIDGGDATWQPLLDWLPLADVNLMGVEGLALDPATRPHLLGSGTTTPCPRVPNGALLRSRDRGPQLRARRCPSGLGGNEGRAEQWRALGGGPAGRPCSSSATTTASGAAATGASFQRVNSFPGSAWRASCRRPSTAELGWQRWAQGTPVFVLFDQRGGVKGQPTQTIYVGIATKPGPVCGAAGTLVPPGAVPSSPTEHRRCVPRWQQTASSHRLRQRARPAQADRRRGLALRHQHQQLDRHHP